MGAFPADGIDFCFLAAPPWHGPLIGFNDLETGMAVWEMMIAH